MNPTNQSADLCVCNLARLENGAEDWESGKAKRSATEEDEGQSIRVLPVWSVVFVVDISPPEGDQGSQAKGKENRCHCGVSAIRKHVEGIHFIKQQTGDWHGVLPCFLNQAHFQLEAHEEHEEDEADVGTHPKGVQGADLGFVGRVVLRKDLLGKVWNASKH